MRIADCTLKTPCAHALPMALLGGDPPRVVIISSNGVETTAPANAAVCPMCPLGQTPFSVEGG